MLHIHLNFTTGYVIFLTHAARMNRLYSLKMTLLVLKHAGILHSVSAYLIFMETVQLIMNNVLGIQIEILFQCNNFKINISITFCVM